ncbi:hypothetical protein GCM10020358_50470 [Amorphoplanes nipponensis]|uniref:DUF6671 domain-containing protein n=1 Tax=Actinoplanes nipponensis TaxID=135950 RepID=A0A919JD89_9ACTN|nr:DUF6671 family protein [Actinoplanes nipponensis]GIE47447.1 hypothetical protein Ani05nite_09810 [Actinoplanes nipponensis]
MPPYRGALVAFGTRHGKHHQVAGAFADVLGARVTAPDDIDTDQYGTFTGETPRTGSPLAAARAKADLARRLTGAGLALASEASYGHLHGSPVAVHEELLLFHDAARDIEVIEGERVPLTLPAAVRIRSVAAAGDFLERAGFGRQALIVRPSAGGSPADIRKGVTAAEPLAAAVRHATERSADGHALVEPDLRACHNPTRRAVLRRLGRRLADRLATGCPACGCPGFGRVDSRPGLPCRACGTPTDAIAADRHGCAGCPHHVLVPRSEPGADPQRCPRCNP